MVSIQLNLNKTAIGLVVIAGLLLLLAACGDAPNSAVIPATPVEEAVSSVVPQGQIQAEQLVTASQGWIVNEQGVLWTTSNGKSWSNITPPGLALNALRGVYFRDASHGLIVKSGHTDASQATPLELMQTENSGKSWKFSPLTDPNPLYTDSYSGSASFDFVDAAHGWLMVKLASSSNFSRGDLFRTADDGQTWTQVTAPLGEPVRFINPTTGWIAGGPDGSQLLVTHDGGENWSSQALKTPPEFEGMTPQYSLPTFQNTQNGVVVVTFAGTAHSGIGFYTTQDGGSSWNVKTVVPIQREIATGTKATSHIFSADSWLYALPSEAQLHLTTQAGKVWQAVTPSGLNSDSNTTIQTLDFVSQREGWLLTSASGCASFKSQCTTRTQLLITSDGGQSWAKIAS